MVLTVRAVVRTPDGDHGLEAGDVVCLPVNVVVYPDTGEVRPRTPWES